MKLKKALCITAILIFILSSMCLNVSAAEVQYTDNMIPTMTSNSAPSGIASADSTLDSNQVAWKAFDHNTTNFNFGWQSSLTSSFPHWLMYEFNSAKKITKYSVTSSTNGNSIGAPKSWTFEGSNDGTNWTVLDTKTNQPNWTELEKRSYVINNSNAFLKYKIVISSSSATTTSILELEMMESVTSTPSAPALSATAEKSKVELTWASITGATSYNVKRSTTAGGPYTTIGTNVTTTTYTDSNITSGTTYYYVVTAVTSNGESANSNEASAAIVASNSAILEVTMTNGTVKEYDMTGTELDSFLTWYDDRSNGTGKSYFTVTKKYNIKPFLSRKEYLPFDKILNFEVKEYSDN